MKEMGIFGLMIPEEYGLGESLLTYALTVEEIARGWMSVSGIINTHFIVAYMLIQHGTEEQKQKYLPRWRPVRSAVFSMSEPGSGRTWRPSAPRRSATATPTLDDQRPEDVADQWRLLEPRRRAGATDPGARTSVYKNMTTFLIEKESRLRRDRPGRPVPGKIEKMGYKGVDTTEMVFDGHTSTDPDPRRRARQGLLPDDGRRRGRPGQRRRPRACGLSMRPSSSASPTPSSARPSARRSPSTRASSRLADMATRLEASHQMMVKAARPGTPGSATTSRRGWRSTSPPRLRQCRRAVLPDPRRLRLPKEYEIERLYREAPMLLIGEGTAEIQKMIIGRRLLEEFAPQG